jgi:hypothetical protein
VSEIATKLAIPAALLFCSPGFAQLLPPAPKAASVTNIQGPALELERDGEAIITWTSNNPGGTDGHIGIVNYGTSPSNLSQTATSPIRPAQPEPSGDGFPCECERPESADNLLLHGDLDGERRYERWSNGPCQLGRPRQMNPRLPSTCAAGYNRSEHVSDR